MQEYKLTIGAIDIWHLFTNLRRSKLLKLWRDNDRDVLVHINYRPSIRLIHRKLSDLELSTDKYSFELTCELNTVSGIVYMYRATRLKSK